jgi:O-antigen ligase
VSRGGGRSKRLAVEDVLVLTAAVGLPWFWGGVGLDAYRTAAALIALAAGWALARNGASGLGLDRRTLWLLPAFLLGAWAFIQAVPLPRPWVARLSPKAASLQADAFGPLGQGSTAWLRQIETDARAHVPEAASASPPRAALDLGSDGAAPPRGFTLSLAPSATLERAFWYSALLLAFLLVCRRTASRRRAAIYRATLFVFFGVLAAVGIANRLTAPARMLWVRDAPADTRPVGPYVNASHFAGVMELAVPWLLGYGLAAVAGRRGPDGHRAARLAALGAAGVGAAATLLAASKTAATTVGFVSIVLIAVAAARSGRGLGRKRAILLAGTAASLLLLVAIALAGPLRGRIADYRAMTQGGFSEESRKLAWSAGQRMAKDFPWTGSGFGALGETLIAYLPRGERDYWAQLHNDYLEVYAAGGLVAAALLVWLAAAFARRIGRSLKLGSDRGPSLSSLGLALGLAALAVHEIVDFNLQIPANALLFVVVAAMGVSPLVESGDAS